MSLVAGVPDDILLCWLAVRAREGCPIAPDSRHRLDIEVDHSLRGGLLGWLLSGHAPLPHPPPLCMSRPWHKLIVNGGAPDSRMDAGARFDRAYGEPVVIVWQHAWRVLEEAEDGSLFVTPFNTAPPGGGAGPWGRWQLRKLSADRTFAHWSLLPLAPLPTRWQNARGV